MFIGFIAALRSSESKLPLLREDGFLDKQFVQVFDEQIDMAMPQTQAMYSLEDDAMWEQYRQMSVRR